MSPRTYRADTMAEALSKVKQDLGRSAMILSTRTVKTGGWLGLGARTVVEITAADDTKSLPIRLRSDNISSRSTCGGVLPTPESRQPSPPTMDTPDHLVVQDELRDIKSLVHDLVEQNQQSQVSKLSEELKQAYLNLIQNQVAEELAREFIRQIESQSGNGKKISPEEVREMLVQQMAQVLKPGCPITIGDVTGSKVVALIGPTGVGKTTTVAKLAAYFRLKEGKKVGLITIDTYRIAAVEQLRTYAKIIDIPLEVALTPEELKQAIKRLKDCDIVLIDTAGRSQFDTLKLNELRQFIESARPHEIHLVLSCNCSEPVLINAVDKFSQLGANRVIVTKLDETVGVGTLLSVMQRVDAQLSYVTTGQDVPNDIEVCDGRRLASMIIDDRQFNN